MLELFKLTYKDIDKIKRLKPRDQGHYLPFDTFPHGCPLGGLGTGTIGRSPYGDFNIWHLKIGAHIEDSLKSIGFHTYQKVKNKITNRLLTTRVADIDELEKFPKPYSKRSGYYAATFPKASYRFKDRQTPAIIECEQFSPVLPHNYKESSYPIAIFKHRITNPTQHPIEVSIMMTFENMIGWTFLEKRPGEQDRLFEFNKRSLKPLHQLKKNNKCISIVLSSHESLAKQDMAGEFCISTSIGPDRTITVQPYFETTGSGQEICDSFQNDGTLINQTKSKFGTDIRVGSAIAVKIKLKPGEQKSIPFVLSWDLPHVEFGPKVLKSKYYTKYFDTTGHNSLKLARLGLDQYKKWSLQIDQWHQSIIDNSPLTKLSTKTTLANYFRMLINELYFIVDGGTYWDAKSGDFGLLESFDYPFYETLDVRFYSSFPLLKFWPDIELHIMKQFARTIAQVNTKMQRYHDHTLDLKLPLPKNKTKRLLAYDKTLIKGSCPHDLGSPQDHPFKSINAYTWQNVNYWKDLNTKFVLLCYRNFIATNDKKFLKNCWPAMKMAMTFLNKFDTDKDGIPENAGYPDQTYDNWIMSGTSAYCGSLWLGAVKAMIHLSKLLKDKKIHNTYQKLFAKASESFERKLWNGRYYDFDESSMDIMTDQIIGQWYFDILNLEPILPRDNINVALKTIYKYNFKQTANGKWGLISGKQPNNQFTIAKQGRDIWVGSNFVIANMMLKHGMIKEAFSILNIVSKIIYEKGLFFRTPEGWDTKGHFTATLYMRPNAIWALEY